MLDKLKRSITLNKQKMSIDDEASDMITNTVEELIQGGELHGGTNKPTVGELTGNICGYNKHNLEHGELVGVTEQHAHPTRRCDTLMVIETNVNGTSRYPDASIDPEFVMTDIELSVMTHKELNNCTREGVSPVSGWAKINPDSFDKHTLFTSDPDSTLELLIDSIKENSK